MERKQPFETLEQVAAYLRACRIRKLTTGDYTFEAMGIADRTQDVRSYFAAHPEHRVNATTSMRFLGLSSGNLGRLNESLADDAKISVDKVVDMGGKYA